MRREIAPARPSRLGRVGRINRRSTADVTSIDDAQLRFDADIGCC